MDMELLADVSTVLTRYRDEEIRFLLRVGFSKEEAIKSVHKISKLLRRIELGKTHTTDAAKVPTPALGQSN
jgi:hypothetical protein